MASMQYENNQISFRYKCGYLASYKIQSMNHWWIITDHAYFRWNQICSFEREQSDIGATPRFDNMLLNVAF